MFDLATSMFVFVRGSAMLAVLPFFSTANFPIMLRVALAALLAFLITPLLPPQAVQAPSIGHLVYLFVIEGATGLLLGFVCRIFFFALELAGTLLATDMGLMLSSQFNPINSAVVQAPALILFWMAGMILLSLDLHHWMLAGFQSSYKMVPIGGAHLSEGLLLAVVGKTSQMFGIALQLCAPVMAVSFVVTLVFALLGRAVPQMNVFSESFPVRTLAGLLVFGLTFNLMGQHIINYLKRLPEDFHQVAKLLG